MVARVQVSRDRPCMTHNDRDRAGWPHQGGAHRHRRECALFRPALAPRAWSLPWTRRGLFGVRRMHSRGKRYYFVLGERADPDDAL